MKIRIILSQHRRDFTAVYACEHCGREEIGAGYDDSNFHQNVIPDKTCGQCGQKAPSTYRPMAPLHSDSEVL